MKIIITEEQKNKLFTPKRLSPEDHRWMDHNKSQPIKNIDGKDIQINQYDYDGKKQGYWEEYYDNGQLKSKGNYSNGKKVGVWKHYDENGDISAIYVKETGYFEFYLKGKISSKGYLKNGVTEGESVSYYMNGNVLMKGNISNGNKDGVWEFYNVDGSLAFKALYKDDILIKRLKKKKSLSEGKLYQYQLNPLYSDPDKREIVYEFENKDGYQFEVMFYNLGDNNWEREYRTMNKGLGILNTNDVYNIMETVTDITISFIEKYEPNNITIVHIGKNKEAGSNKPTKRALLNKKYLAPAINKLDDYYYKLLGSTSYISRL